MHLLYKLLMKFRNIQRVICLKRFLKKSLSSMMSHQNRHVHRKYDEQNNNSKKAEMELLQWLNTELLAGLYETNSHLDCHTSCRNAPFD